jgi:serpin B
MAKTSTLTLILSLGTFLIGCSNNPISLDDQSGGLNWRELNLAEKKLVESDNAFGLKLFKEINYQEDTGKNIFISPLSVSMALGMTYNGAAGSTEDAMRSTLEYGSLTNDEVNESYKSLIGLLRGLDPEVVFQIANSIWYKHGYPIEKDFIDLNIKYFDALVKEMNFADPGAAGIINGWVYDNTNGRIEEIVQSPIDPSIVMFLINAIYFKGTWTYEFEKEKTTDDWFTLPDGSQEACRMMTLEGDLGYFITEDFQAVDLPYGGSAYSMTIILPREGVDLDFLIGQLGPENWADWMDRFSEAPVELYLPSFSLEYELKMNYVLKALGMSIAFTPSANFSRMCKTGGLFISEVRHKSFVEVNEEGTEAAAVTVVVMTDSADGGPILMRIDRPFIFVIRENHSQTILFMGKIVQPTTA